MTLPYCSVMLSLRKLDNRHVSFNMREYVFFSVCMQGFVYIRKNVSDSAKQIEVSAIWVFTQHIVHVITILTTTECGVTQKCIANY